MKRSIPDSVRGIVIADDFSSAPWCYGGVVMNEDELAALSLPPKFAIYSCIDTADCETQVEKGLAKLQWSISKQESQVGEPVGEKEQTSFRTGVNGFDTRYMRATELPLNQRITL